MMAAATRERTAPAMVTAATTESASGNDGGCGSDKGDSSHSNGDDEGNRE